MHSSVRRYLSQIGRRGGMKSRRSLSSQTAREMVKLREARKAFQRFQTSCFWSYNPQRVISPLDIPWIVNQLRRYGDRRAWETALRLCR